MKKLLVAAMFCFACLGTAALAGEDWRSWAYKYVLATSGHPREFATILEHLEDEPELRQVELVDYLAEVLLSIDKKTDRASVELKGMLASFLRKHGGPRYLVLFQKLTKPDLRAAQGLASITAYIKQYRDTKAEQYVPGTVNLHALREQFLAEALAARPTEDQARRMAVLPVNAHPDELIAQIGRPQYIGSGQLRVGERILIDVHIQRMTFFYRGLGKVTFQFQNGIGWIARDREVDPEAFEDVMPYREHAELFGLPSDEAVGFAQLLSGHSMAIKIAAESRTLHGGATPQFLDAAAQLLLENHVKVVEPRMVDSYAWICRLLVSHGGPRYGKVLATVKTGAASSKLRRFAGLRWEKTAPATGDPYVPGSVSLTGLRAKFPPLYPQRGLTSSSFPKGS